MTDEVPVNQTEVKGQVGDNLTSPQSTTDSGNLIMIRFVEPKGNESEVLSPWQENSGPVFNLLVEPRDPRSRVACRVTDYQSQGEKVCYKNRTTSLQARPILSQ